MLKSIKDWRLHGLTIAHIVLIVSLIAAFCALENVLIYGPMLFWCVLAFGKWLANTPWMMKWIPRLRQVFIVLGFQRENEASENRILECVLRYNMGSRILIYLYTVLLVVFGLTQRHYLSTNILTFINGVSAVSVLYLFGNKAVVCSLIAVCGAWFVELFQAVFIPGDHSFWINMELHDLSFGAGYIFLYYLLAHYKWTKKHIFCFIIVTIAILIAFKRIEIAALALTAIVWLVLCFCRSNKIRRKLLHWGSVAAIVGCYLFVAMLITGLATKLLEAVGINPMGRNYYYAALAEKCQFTPWFLGLGRNAVATLFATEFEYFHVGNVHSDIFRMYAECGFVLFGLWLCVYWWILPRAIEKRCGYKAMEFYWLCTLYTFIVYATDNTELYLINQYFYMLMPIHVALNAKNISQRRGVRSSRGKALRSSKELVSVIMSTYNEDERQLAASIGSILNQSYKNIEFIIVNDNPKNAQLRDLLEQYAQKDKRIVLVENPENIGLVNSLNKALSYIKGDYVARMDADDIARQDRISQQMRHLKNNELDFVGGYIRYIDEENNALGNTWKVPTTHEQICRAILWGNCLPHPTWLLRREVYEALGGYRHIPHAEDYDFILRAIKAGFQLGNVPAVLLNYRVRATGISVSNKMEQNMIRYYLGENRRDIFKITEEMVEEKRADQNNPYYRYDAKKNALKNAIKSKRLVQAAACMCKLITDRFFWFWLVEKARSCVF